MVRRVAPRPPAKVGLVRRVAPRPYAKVGLVRRVAPRPPAKVGLVRRVAPRPHAKVDLRQQCLMHFLLRLLRKVSLRRNYELLDHGHLHRCRCMGSPPALAELQTPLERHDAESG